MDWRLQADVGNIIIKGVIPFQVRILGVGEQFISEDETNEIDNMRILAQSREIIMSSPAIS